MANGEARRSHKALRPPPPDEVQSASGMRAPSSRFFKAGHRRTTRLAGGAFDTDDRQRAKRGNSPRRRRDVRAHCQVPRPPTRRFRHVPEPCDIPAVITSTTKGVKHFAAVRRHDKERSFSSKNMPQTTKRPPRPHQTRGSSITLGRCDKTSREPSKRKAAETESGPTISYVQRDRDGRG